MDLISVTRALLVLDIVNQTEFDPQGHCCQLASSSTPSSAGATSSGGDLERLSTFGTPASSDALGATMALARGQNVCDDHTS